MKREVDLPGKVWGYIDQCLASGLYGDTKDEVMLSLMRTGGFDQAVRIGVITLPGHKPKRRDRRG